MKQSKENINKNNDQLDIDISELQQKIGELTTGWQRTQADFLNFKKQTAEDRLKLIKSANEDLLLELLPILDNFQLASQHLPEDLASNNWAIGIKQIEKQFESVLFGQGLERIDSIGKEFDPYLHEAIEKIDSDQPENTILEEILSGYKINNTVIRPAKVKVSNNKQTK